MIPTFPHLVHKNHPIKIRVAWKEHQNLWFVDSKSNGFIEPVIFEQRFEELVSVDAMDDDERFYLFSYAHKLQIYLEDTQEKNLYVYEKFRKYPLWNIGIENPYGELLHPWGRHMQSHGLRFWFLWNESPAVPLTWMEAICGAERLILGDLYNSQNQETTLQLLENLTKNHPDILLVVEYKETGHRFIIGTGERMDLDDSRGEI